MSEKQWSKTFPPTVYVKSDLWEWGCVIGCMFHFFLRVNHHCTWASRAFKGCYEWAGQSTIFRNTFGDTGASGSGAEGSVWVSCWSLGEDLLFFCFLLLSRWKRKSLVEALIVLFFEDPGNTSSSQSCTFKVQIDYFNWTSLTNFLLPQETVHPTYSVNMVKTLILLNH